MLVHNVHNTIIVQVPSSGMNTSQQEIINIKKLIKNFSYLLVDTYWIITKKKDPLIKKALTLKELEEFNDFYLLKKSLSFDNVIFHLDKPIKVYCTNNPSDPVLTIKDSTVIRRGKKRAASFILPTTKGEDKK